MGLQWTLVAVFLYSEIAFVIILLLPIISPSRWYRIFKSRICQTIAKQANVYFIMFIGILVMFFIDSIREMRKYTATKEHSGHSHLEAELQVSMKLFRSQRNYYIAGFALFLWLVIRRLVTLISAQADLLACCDAYKMQAESTTEAAERLIEERRRMEAESVNPGETEDNRDNSQLEEQKIEIQKLKEELERTKTELSQSKINIQLLKDQASDVTEEYDNLLEEHSKLQREIKEISCAEEDEKDE